MIRTKLAFWFFSSSCFLASLRAWTTWDLKPSAVARSDMFLGVMDDEDSMFGGGAFCSCSYCIPEIDIIRGDCCSIATAPDALALAFVSFRLFGLRLSYYLYWRWLCAFVA